MSNASKTGAAKQTQEPQQAEQVTEALETLRQYGIPSLLGVAIALAIGIPAFLYSNHVKARKASAMELLSKARAPQELENILTSYGSTPAASLAMLRLAKVQYDQGLFDKSVQTYANFLSRFPSHEFRSVAEMGKIHCLEARGETEAALAAFAKFLAADPKHYLASQALLGKARCLQTLGKLDDARAVLEDFMAANPKSRWLSRVEEMLQQIQKAKDSPASGPTVSVVPPAQPDPVMLPEPPPAQPAPVPPAVQPAPTP